MKSSLRLRALFVEWKVSSGFADFLLFEMGNSDSSRVYEITQLSIHEGFLCLRCQAGLTFSGREGWASLRRLHTLEAVMIRRDARTHIDTGHGSCVEKAHAPTTLTIDNTELRLRLAHTYNIIDLNVNVRSSFLHTSSHHR